MLNFAKFSMICLRFIVNSLQQFTVTQTVQNLLDRYSNIIRQAMDPTSKSIRNRPIYSHHNSGVFFNICTAPLLTGEWIIIWLWNEWWPFSFTIPIHFFFVAFLFLNEHWVFKIFAEIRFIHRFCTRHHAPCKCKIFMLFEASFEKPFSRLYNWKHDELHSKHLYFQFLIWFFSGTFLQVKQNTHKKNYEFKFPLKTNYDHEAILSLSCNNLFSH